MIMDAVFKALADPSRRRLLDCLFDRDGQSLSELVEHLPMSRFGVMKHLALLEKAGLIVVRRQGRFKYHYLNPVPIRGIQDRWISKYAAPWTETLTGLKKELEGRNMEKPKHVFQIYVRAPADEVWESEEASGAARELRETLTLILGAISRVITVSVKPVTRPCNPPLVTTRSPFFTAVSHCRWDLAFLCWGRMSKK